MPTLNEQYMMGQAALRHVQKAADGASAKQVMARCQGCSVAMINKRIKFAEEFTVEELAELGMLGPQPINFSAVDVVMRLPHAKRWELLRRYAQGNCTLDELADEAQALKNPVPRGGGRPQRKRRPRTLFQALGDTKRTNQTWLDIQAMNWTSQRVQALRREELTELPPEQQEHAKECVREAINRLETIIVASSQLKFFLKTLLGEPNGSSENHQRQRVYDPSAYPAIPTPS